MSGSREETFWVSGLRYNVAYEVDSSDGRVLRRVVTKQEVGATAGIGERCYGVFVAIVVAVGGDMLVLQVGNDFYPITDGVVAHYQRRLCGLASRVTFEEPGLWRTSVRRWNGLGGPVQSLFDPAYDDFDRESDDFLSIVTRIVNSPETQAYLVGVYDRDAEPEVG